MFRSTGNPRLQVHSATLSFARVAGTQQLDLFQWAVQVLCNVHIHVVNYGKPFTLNNP